MRTGIARSDGKNILLKKGGTTQDIVNTILDVIPDVKEQTKGFAKQFTADVPGMRKLWAWVRDNIRYEEDELGVQWVREPARLWHDRVGDCKSFTVFIISVLENLGVDYRVRFSNTEKPGSKIVNHVYPIAIINRREVIVDSVYPAFDRQKSFYYAKDYTMTDIYRLSGIGAAASETLDNYLADLQRATADISDDVLDNDITEMSAGEFARWQQAQHFDAHSAVAKSATNRARFQAAASAVRSGSIAGIGGLAPSDSKKISQFLAETSGQNTRAFMPPVVVIPEGISGIGSLGDVLKNAWKKIINWIFKTAMPLAGPFFLYTFINKKVGQKTDAKKAKQQKVLNWIQTAGQFDSKDAVMQAVKTSIVKKMGKSPETILNDAAKGNKIAGIGFVVSAAMAAISFVVEIITKIANLFKKNKVDVDKTGAADLDELSIESAATGKADVSTNPNSSSSSGSNNMLLFGAVALGGAVLLAKSN